MRKPKPEEPKVPLSEIWEALRLRTITEPVALYPASPQLVGALRYRIYRRLAKWGLKPYYRVETHYDHVVIVPDDQVGVDLGTPRHGYDVGLRGRPKPPKPANLSKLLGEEDDGEDEQEGDGGPTEAES